MIYESIEKENGRLAVVKVGQPKSFKIKYLD